MESSLPQELLDQIHREQMHFAAAPPAFFNAWKRGVGIAGPHLFGDGTREGWVQATDKWALRPNTALIQRAIGPMSPSEKLFLAAMVSFYNSRTGGALLKRADFEGLADFGGLDLERRKVIADLLMQYSGW